MFEVQTIASGSSGNSYLLKTESETLILECGVPIPKIVEALNYNLRNVSGCLVSHEHQDHSKGIAGLVKKSIDVYASKGTIEAVKVTGHRVYVIKAGQQFQVGGFSVLPFAIEHDASEPLGFLIQHNEIGKLVFATDTYYVRYKFKGLSYIMIECNYSKAILDESIKSGFIEPYQVSRLLKSHFSLERVKEFLSANDLTGLKKIFLMHLSNRNADSKKFKYEIERLTGVPVEVC